jgi:hypothetical protein
VTVETGDKPNAGTDADVYVNLIGEDGECGNKKISRSLHDDFEKGR